MTTVRFTTGTSLCRCGFERGTLSGGVGCRRPAVNAGRFSPLVFTVWTPVAQAVAVAPAGGAGLFGANGGHTEAFAGAHSPRVGDLGDVQSEAFGHCGQVVVGWRHNAVEDAVAEGCLFRTAVSWGVL